MTPVADLYTWKFHSSNILNIYKRFQQDGLISMFYVIWGITVKCAIFFDCFHDYIDKSVNKYIL